MLLSITIHLLVVFGVAQGAFSTAENLMARVMPELINMEALKQQEKKQRSMIFLEVPPSMATEEAPEDADHYSNNNSQAADKQDEKNTNKPKIEGSQEEMHRIIDNAPLPKPKPEEQPKKKTEPTVETKPKPKPKQAESLNPIQAKPEEKPKPKVEHKPKPKPRRPNSVAEARRMAMLTGKKMKQDGGVRKKTSFEGLNAKSSLYGQYDARLFDTIENRWQKNLEFIGRELGRVEITFTLWENGEVSDIKVERSTVDNPLLELKCERAISDSAPYDPWPAKMREDHGDRRFVRLSFTYH